LKEERERKERERQEEERREEERKEEEENQRLIEMREKLKTRSAKLVRRISSTESTADVELPEQTVEPEPELTEEPETETDKPEGIQEPEVETEVGVTEDSGPEVVEQEQEQEQETAPEEDTAPKPETESDEIHPEPQPELQPEPPSEVVETAEEQTEQEVEDQKELIEGEQLSPEVETPDVSADVVEQQADEGSNEGALTPVTVVDVPAPNQTEYIPVSGTETEAIPVSGPEPETVSLSVPEPPEMFPMSTQTEEEEPIPPVETECRETQVKLLFFWAK
jgi:hypothetical protein